MATMVSTTLAKRSGSNTVFTPKGVFNRVGLLASPATFAEQSHTMEIKAERPGSRRVSRVRFTIPQLDTSNADNPKVVRSGWAEVTVSIPDGFPVASINDLVGYIEKATAAAVTNVNDLLVNGDGVY